MIKELTFINTLIKGINKRTIEKITIFTDRKYNKTLLATKFVILEIHYHKIGFK